MSKKIWWALVSVLLVVSGCSRTLPSQSSSSSTSFSETQTSSQSTIASSTGATSESSSDLPVQQTVTLYFPNQKYIEFGQEADNYYLTETRLVPKETANLAEFVVQELLKGPQNTTEATSGIPASVGLNQVNLLEETAYVDLKQQGLAGSSLQEYFLINQMVKSLLDLEQIKAVQFLVDGEIVESLMGHYEVNQPLTSVLD